VDPSVAAPPPFIITGLDPVIFFGGQEKDARVKPGHDEKLGAPGAALKEYYP